jgi:hypothetical protein
LKLFTLHVWESNEKNNLFKYPNWPHVANMCGSQMKNSISPKLPTC